MIKFDFIDICKAVFDADARRFVYVDLQKEDATEGKRGKVRKSSYGTRDAAQHWTVTHIKFMEGAGIQRGAASPFAFWHARRQVREVVHGDDFTMMAYVGQLGWFKEGDGEKIRM